MGIQIDPAEVARSSQALASLSTQVAAHVPDLAGLADAIPGADSAAAIGTAQAALVDLGERLASLISTQADAVAACARDHQGTDETSARAHRGGYRTAMDAV